MCQTPTARGWVPLACTCGAGTGDAGSFEHIVIASPRPVAVVFWGPDCWPCQVLAPTLEHALEEYGDRATFVALDIAQSPLVAARLGVQGIPHLLFFAHGNVCCHFAGEIPWVYLCDKLERALSLQSSPSQTSHPRFTRPS